MTSHDLATFLLSKNQGQEAVKALGQLIPAMVALNSVLFQALDCQHQPGEPATDELFALSQLTSDLYALRNELQQRVDSNYKPQQPPVVTNAKLNEDGTYTLTTNMSGIKMLIAAEHAFKENK